MSGCVAPVRIVSWESIRIHAVAGVAVQELHGYSVKLPGAGHIFLSETGLKLVGAGRQPRVDQFGLFDWGPVDFLRRFRAPLRFRGPDRERFPKFSRSIRR